MGLPLRLGTACDVAWKAMTHAEGGRHCSKCDRVVRDLSRATEREARGWGALYSAEGLCARVRVDDGETVFREEKRTASLRGRVAFAAITVGAAGCAEVPLRSSSPPAPAATIAEPVSPTTVAADSSTPLATPTAAPSDRDKDGVLDDEDHCPDEPGAAPDGCPQHIVVTASGDMIILERVHFVAGSATPLKEGQPILDAVFAVLQSHPEIHRIEVHGNVDGKEPGGNKLARDRAERVVDFLVKRGIARNRLIPLGDGSSKPIAPANTVEGRAENRRIEFRVIPDDETST